MSISLTDLCDEVARKVSSIYAIDRDQMLTDHNGLPLIGAPVFSYRTFCSSIPASLSVAQRRDGYNSIVPTDASLRCSRKQSSTTKIKTSETSASSDIQVSSSSTSHITSSVWPTCTLSETVNPDGHQAPFHVDDETVRAIFGTIGEDDGSDNPLELQLSLAQSLSEDLCGQVTPISTPLDGLETLPQLALSRSLSHPVVAALVGRQYQRYLEDTRLVVGSIPFRTHYSPYIVTFFISEDALQSMRAVVSEKVLDDQDDLGCLDKHHVKSESSPRYIELSLPIVRTKVEFLCISSSRKDEFILPKGGWEQFESSVDGALRETLEESGIRSFHHSCHVAHEISNILRSTKSSVAQTDQGVNSCFDAQHSTDPNIDVNTDANIDTNTNEVDIFSQNVSSSLEYIASIPFLSPEGSFSLKPSGPSKPVKEKHIKGVTTENRFIAFLLRAGSVATNFAEDRIRRWVSLEEMNAILYRPHMKGAFQALVSELADVFEQRVGGHEGADCIENLSVSHPSLFKSLLDGIQEESAWTCLMELCDEIGINVSMSPQTTGDLLDDTLNGCLDAPFLECDPTITILPSLAKWRPIIEQYAFEHSKEIKDYAGCTNPILPERMNTQYRSSSLNSVSVQHSLPRNAEAIEVCDILAGLFGAKAMTWISQHNTADTTPLVSDSTQFKQLIDVIFALNMKTTDAVVSHRLHAILADCHDHTSLPRGFREDIDLLTNQSGGIIDKPTQ